MTLVLVMITVMRDYNVKHFLANLSKPVEFVVQQTLQLVSHVQVVLNTLMIKTFAKLVLVNPFHAKAQQWQLMPWVSLDVVMVLVHSPI